jgi:5'-methylthioadenosine phosphorylase
MPEAKLAREAEIPYASVAMVTDYDCWRDDHGHVEVSTVIAHLLANADTARAVVKQIAAAVAKAPRTPSPQGIETCLDHALITAPEQRDPAVVKKLDAVAGRVLRAKA